MYRLSSFMNISLVVMFYEVSKVVVQIYLESNTIFLILIWKVSCYCTSMVSCWIYACYNGVVVYIFTIKGWYIVGSVVKFVATVELLSVFLLLKFGILLDLRSSLSLLFEHVLLSVDRYYMQVNISRICTKFLC